ncbi:histidinol-phosphate transaminase [Terrilactibacillus laevilacticus]|uniref:Histidinol-phosphate aminotransferase n=1 Tax=Terrilactibacillus laevilacticus TaxID=1380157 RepID=A0ABW5PSP2_9BACI|nr:histidinol-phosphate transaminase [Terrilactibacillus laevilacticus]
MGKPQLSAMTAFDPGQSIEELKRIYHLDKIIKLDTNENIYGASPMLMEKVADAIRDLSNYPDCKATILREALAKKYHISPNSLLFGSGLDEVIQIINRTFLDDGDNIVAADPTFSEYYIQARIEGAEVRKVPTVEGKHDLEGMLQAIDKHTQLVWICNPNNPTGTYLNEQELSRFVSLVPKDTTIVVDEAYIEYVSATDYPDTLSLLKHHQNVIILRTFSKAYGLASFRIGYAMADQSIINKLEITRLPFNTSKVSQLAAYAALEDQEFLLSCVRKNKKARDFVVDYCQSHDIKCFPSQTNFVFITLENPKSAHEALLKAGFLTQLHPNGLRISMGEYRDMKDLCQLLSDHLKKELV